MCSYRQLAGKGEQKTCNAQDQKELDQWFLTLGVHRLSKELAKDDCDQLAACAHPHLQFTGVRASI